MNIVLIGYRGTGKTTIAHLLGQRLDMKAVDADVVLEQRASRTIADIFATDGEGTFRDLETEVVRDLAQGDRQVLGLGGGAVLREENRKAIASAGFTVWLQASIETIDRRMRGDDSTSTKRPNLTRSGGLTEIEEVLTARTPLYEACADAIVDTENKTPEQVADEIVRLVQPTLES